MTKNPPPVRFIRRLACNHSASRHPVALGIVGKDLVDLVARWVDVMTALVVVVALSEFQSAPQRRNGNGAKTGHGEERQKNYCDLAGAVDVG